MSYTLNPSQLRVLMALDATVDRNGCYHDDATGRFVSRGGGLAWHFLLPGNFIPSGDREAFSPLFPGQPEGDIRAAYWAETGKQCGGNFTIMGMAQALEAQTGIHFFPGKMSVADAQMALGPVYDLLRKYPKLLDQMALAKDVAFNSQSPFAEAYIPSVSFGEPSPLPASEAPIGGTYGQSVVLHLANRAELGAEYASFIGAGFFQPCNKKKYDQYFLMHEIGHLVHFGLAAVRGQLGGNEFEFCRQELDKIYNAAGIVPSFADNSYAGTNSVEEFAEVFATAICGGGTPEGAAMLDWLKANYA